MATENLEIIIGANTQDLQTGLNQASQSVTNFGNAVRTNLKPTADATNALSNLSRVAQDAPYGFMGIANNLNPLLESFQRLQKEAGGTGGALKALLGGLTGPAGIGLALGVVSSLIVKFGDDISKFVSDLANAGGATEQMKNAIKGIGSEFTGAVAKVNKVEIAFKEYHEGLLTGNQALKIYNTELGKVFGTKSNINDAEATFKANTTNYIEATFQRALADQAAKKAAEELLKQRELTAKGPQINYLDYLGGGMGPQSTSSVKKAAEIRLANDIAESQKIINSYKDIAKQATDLAIQLSPKGIQTPVNDIVKPKTGSTSTQQAEKVDTSILETLKLKQRLYQDDVYAYKEYADKIVNEELRIALEKAKINKASANEIESIKEQSNLRLQINQVQFGKTLDKLFDEADKEWIKGQKETNKKIEEEEKRSAKELEKIEKEKASQLKELQKQHEQFAEVISQNVTNALFTMYDAIQAGEPPLKALGDFLANLAKQFAAAIIQATIFKGIMALLNTVTGGGSGFFGSILGSVSKIFGAAEGGIVSQPTILMTGEGGQSEAIMPLNKLGNMMNSTFNAGAMSGGGAGNGQFVLKGNDLVLALQRSNYSLNLRRGA